ncbi:hypothetical protein V6N11_039849 [Hibiscus sabdariffa]|uniref:TRF2/HOY1 PH-like domain-containing protein n=1 Tax=Hibiscus sabdariffa TaxID=183260 RepID=A0ABR2RGC9_9ROSI
MMTKICTKVNGEPALDPPIVDVSSKEFHDLVAKCYFVKSKLVWEVLYGGLKNKIETMMGCWIVSSTYTNIKKKELEFNILLFDANKTEMSTMHTLKSYSHLLVSIPFVIGIGDMMLQHRELLKSTSMDCNFQWFCYLSSTNVYGVCRGVYVGDDYPTSPTNEIVLRGIYGSNRSVVEITIKQEPLSEFQKQKVSKQFTSRVHVADNCQALKTITCTQLSKRIYSIIDDDPTSQRKVFAYALNLVEKRWHCPTKKFTCHDSVKSFVQKASFRSEKQATMTTFSFSNFRYIATNLAFSSSRARSNILIRLKQIAAKEISSMCQATKEKDAGVLMSWEWDTEALGTELLVPLQVATLPPSQSIGKDEILINSAKKSKGKNRKA